MSEQPSIPIPLTSERRFSRISGKRLVGFVGEMPTRPCRHRSYEADQSLTRDTARDREFETLGLGSRFGGDGRESRAGAGETRPARDVGGSGCGESRFDEKSRRVSTAAFWFTLRSVRYDPVGFSCGNGAPVERSPTCR